MTMRGKTLKNSVELGVLCGEYKTPPTTFVVITWAKVDTKKAGKERILSGVEFLKVYGKVFGISPFFGKVLKSFG